MDGFVRGHLSRKEADAMKQNQRSEDTLLAIVCVVIILIAMCMAFNHYLGKVQGQ